MRLLVVGAGATGGYFGGRLAEHGRDVTFLVRDARAAQLKKDGLQIISPNGDAKVTPKVVTAKELKEPYEAILMTVKAFGLEQSLEDIAPAVGPDTMILPTLNGMRHMDVIAKRFSARNATPCVCKVAATLDKEGRIVQLAKFQDLSYGEADGKPSPRTEALDKFMQGAGFDVRHSPHIMREMWEKWTLLSSLGGITGLMRGNIGEIEAAPGGVDFVLAFLDEVLSIVRKVGVAPSEEFLKATRATLTSKGSPQAPSMYRDLVQGYRIEADQIVGDLLKRGQDAGLKTPLIAAAYTNLSIYSARQAKA
ncbi:2-dehydropantoate 2-reductase [Variibacter gotjawalensis]|uniref:2-dehydropantoate 2-reductase n=1 Tax=Variibacter gotjawalensis TaxID=1333996 RepID=A0A0S3PZD9_9BRAD|nr:ketopantoate reductase family protein [Variibacter gotjawalensis]NIK47146.1 2-dehydropantoate 2-reductase [Variibacter gotjawalensis]RZS49046.1 ketopantoate reductase [Variibacter gotjawalensis]BAT61308.1 2-dehydropantoate 2-reductase [Variibacter gotjawalensis]